ncbi:hypothetical protein DPMN_114727 [Dreissena polymorpha]|uniref:KY-like immunoglobulin-like domain-containing protein n=2 Tax=Dreissena polymorpha TaxID=45954 RepID=A0A9D4KK20_DREPO|nr:hypothetical protein DPMN_114727 [Dreissena polymorpha]
MGSGSTKYIDPVKVPRTKGKYPPPAPPKWLLPELRPLVTIPEAVDPRSQNVDWDVLEHILDAELEDGVDASNNEVYKKGTNDVMKKSDYEEIRPPSSRAAARSRTDSGYKRAMRARKIGQKTVLSFGLIDKHARTVTAKQSSTFVDLIAFLSQPIDQSHFPHTCLVRALTLWFAEQPTQKTGYLPAPLDTPGGILQNLRNQTLTYTEAYALICRAANIPTVIIPGYVKAGKYEPGDIVDRGAADTWCAVHVDGSWQLIHPLWVCNGTYGSEKGNLVQIEDDPYLAAKAAARAKADKKHLEINEEFFMPRPDVFIYRCYARNIEWHLISTERTLKSLEEFSQVAYISPAFFTYGLKLVTEPYCVQTAINGVVLIVIMAPKAHAHRMNMGYALEADEEDPAMKSQGRLLHKKVLNKLVLNYRSNDSFIFEIRLPVTGTYKLTLNGGFGTELSNLCRFKLVSNDTQREWFFIPVEPGPSCWGPGPMAERVGLLLASKPSGVLLIQPKAHSGVSRDVNVYYHLTTLNFHINKALYRKYDYTAEVVPSTFVQDGQVDEKISSFGDVKGVPSTLNPKGKDQDENENNIFPVRIQMTKDASTRQLSIQVIGRLDGGECAIVIKATEMEVRNNLRMPRKDSTVPVCYYLLSGNTVTLREPTEIKLAKQSLQEAMSREDINRIQAAVVRCLRMKIPPTDDEIAAADAKLEYLRLKKDIIDCVKRRNAPIVTETLRKVVNYRYREALVIEVEKLLNFRSELLGLQGYTKELPGIREANEELYKLTSPSPAVHNTLKALLLLLGYKGDTKDWGYIHSQLTLAKDKLNQLTLIKRMEYMSETNFPWGNMDLDTLDNVNSIVHKYTYQHVSHGSQAAATMYKWIDAMLIRARDYFRNAAS